MTYQQYFLLSGDSGIQKHSRKPSKCISCYVNITTAKHIHDVIPH